MRKFTREDTARSVLELPEIKRYLNIFVADSLIDCITEEYKDQTLGELEKCLTMPWGGPFIPEIVIDGAERVRELLEEKRFSFLPLWTEEAEEGWIPETRKNDKENVCLMRLSGPAGETADLPDSADARPAAVLCPGGGYENLSMQNEGIDFAERLGREGYETFVLLYRVSPNRYPEPQKDLALAIKYLRANAAKYRIDPNRILIVGSSAAGHLCASESAYSPEIDALLMEDLRESQPGLAGTLEGISARADRVCLVYPVIDFLNYAHEPSFQAISGGSEELRDKLSIQKHVPKEFPPTYAWACRDDELVPCENCELIARALEEAGVPCKSHIYPQGGHGCGLAKGTSAEGWMDEMLEFYRGSLSCE